MWVQGICLPRPALDPLLVALDTECLQETGNFPSYEILDTPNKFLSIKKACNSYLVK